MTGTHEEERYVGKDLAAMLLQKSTGKSERKRKRRKAKARCGRKVDCACRVIEKFFRTAAYFIAGLVRERASERASGQAAQSSA